MLGGVPTFRAGYPSLFFFNNDGYKNMWENKNNGKFYIGSSTDIASFNVLL
jgi:hypothetical protein